MTKQEFYLRSILAMASNPKYVKMEKGDDNVDTYPDLQIFHILEDAGNLLSETESNWQEAFDERGINSSLSEISDAVNELNDIGITVF